MGQRTAHPFRPFVLVLVSLFLAIAVQSPALASTSTDWLLSHATDSGAVIAAGDTAYPYQTTAESLRALHAEGVSSSSATQKAEAYLATQSTSTTEALSRRIIVANEAGGDFGTLVTQLLSYQNRDGGFGESEGFQSTLLDTAYALEALSAVATEQSEAIGQALAYLRDRQNPDGSWSQGTESGSVYLTAVVTTSMHLHRSHFQLSDIIQASTDYLLSQRNSGGAVGNEAETALTILAVAPTVSDKSVYQSSVEYLQSVQLSDGSWGDDAYTTALVGRALSLTAQPEPNPELGSITGRLTDGVTLLDVPGVSVTLAGPVSITMVSDNQGSFVFNSLPAGEYSLSVNSESYSPVLFATSLVAGDTVDFGTIRMLQQTGAVTAALQGTVTNSAGVPIPGVVVAIGSSTNAAVTDETGFYGVSGLSAGDVTLVVQKEGYEPLAQTLALEAGALMIFNAQLEPVQEPHFSIAGTVTASDTGTALDGASITLTGDSTGAVTTDTSGYFKFDGLSPGNVTITAVADGYQASTAVVTALDGQNLIFSPALALVGTTPGTPTSAALSGKVVDVTSGLPVGGALVTTTVDGNVFEASSDSAGNFLLENLSPGAARITISADGYTLLQAETYYSDNVTTDTGVVALSPVGYYPAVTVTGIAVDASSNKPIPGAVISVSFESFTASVTSGDDGSFVLEGKAEVGGTLQINADGYVSAELPVFLTVESAALGTIRLRPESFEDARADLVVSALDDSSLVKEATTLSLSGALGVTVANHGATPTEGNVELIAYFDANHDGSYSDEEDTFFGRSFLEQSISADGEVTQYIDVAGTLPFRDAPLSVFVDAGYRVPESEEGNNTLSTASLCGYTPPEISGSLDVALKWQSMVPYEGREYSSSTGPVAVGQFSDDNGDGKIDSNDIPDIVAGVGIGGNSPSDTMLAVLSGDTGELIWGRSDVPAGHRAVPAIGDIDGDGYYEILITNLRGQKLSLVEHDGTLSWTIDTGFANYTGAAHAPVIADLNEDGSPEIVLGHNVYDKDGNLLWSGEYDYGSPYTVSSATAPIVADVHPSPGKEVIAGRTLYAADGSVLWHRSKLKGDGLSAVGNFDDDDEAEIVLVARGRVILLENTGETIWDVPLGSGRGGAPTVADFDSDGEPEIGVAGKVAYYVFETDGTLKWSTKINDATSHMTGSSVFDFNNDGKAEVLYADEVKFRIMDGTTGDVLYETLNDSVTKIEYPVVADVDNDGQAEIVLTSNPYRNASSGIRVFEAANDDWAPTRSIWNQFSYHINNINDDGSIPVKEDASWLTHNTYRLNRFIDAEGYLLPDLTASLVKLEDQGAGQSLLLKVRVGNAGGKGVPEGTMVSFYDGAPENGGRLLGSVSLPAIGSGDFADIEFDSVPVAELSGNDLVVIADEHSAVSECRGDNNRAEVPSVPVSLLGAVTIATDKAQYGDNDSVILQAVGSNVGSYAGAFQVQLSIADLAGNTVLDLGSQALGVIESAASVELPGEWNTSGSLTGTYLARTVMLDGSGQALAEASAPFIVTSGIDGSPDASVSLSTDKPIYHMTDTVSIEQVLKNLTTNHVIDTATLQLTVYDPQGVAVYDITQSPGVLVPLALRQLIQLHGLDGAAEGQYLVNAVLQDAGVTLASSSTTFQVRADYARTLSGSVQVALPSLYQGETQSCTASVVNSAVLGIDDLPVRQLVVSVDSGESYQQSEQTQSLSPGGEYQWSDTYTTGSLPIGHAACLLQTQIEGEWNTIAYKAFEVTEPPINIDSSMSVSGGMRLLVLMDDSDCAAVKHRHHNDAEENKHRYENEARGCHDADKGAGKHRASDEPDAGVEKARLTELLDSSGLSYTLTTDAESFTKAFRSGSYTGYALFSERIKLDEQVQKELREAVNRGEGLLVAGSHDQRNGRLAEPLGVTVHGKYPRVSSLVLDDSELHAAADTVLMEGDTALRSDSRGAEVLGYFPMPAGDRRNAKALHTIDGKDGRGESCKQCKEKAKACSHHHDHDSGLAVSRYAYGEGTSVFFAFDILAEMAKEDAAPLFGELLLGGLNAIAPDNVDSHAGSAVPISLSLHNLGMATPGQVLISLPDDVALLDGGDAALQTDGSLLWPFDLAEDEVEDLSFWLQLPLQEGPVYLESLIQTGEAPDLSDYDSVLFTLQVEAVTQLDALASEAESMGGRQSRHLRKALQHAYQASLDGRYAKSLKWALQVADILAANDSAEARSLRLRLDFAIRELARQVGGDDKHKYHWK